MGKMLFVLCLMFNLNAYASDANHVQTVESVDLNQYLGEWYEVAAIPQSFQKMCVKNVTANYSLTESGLVKVVNSCETKTGQIKIANARAKVVDKVTNAKLNVTFVKIFNWVFSLGGKYWILDLGENYSYAVVGDPTRKFGWILSRTKDLSADELNKAKEALVRNGYDLCKFKMTIQDGGQTESLPLCEI